VPVRERASLTEDMGGRDGQVEREFSREVAVGEPTHTVGAEETAHDSGRRDQRLLY
jgi:hypothetical protein